MSETQPSKSGLSPAAWSAIAAITVAVIGGAVTLTTAWWSHQPPKATADPAAGSAASARPLAQPPTDQPPTAPDAQDPSTWAGSYGGDVRAPDGSTFKVLVDLTPGCARGATCGTIGVPHIPCTGRLTLVDTRAEGAEFSVDHFDKASDPKVCQPGAGEVLRRLPSGDLDYTATYSGAHGVLHASQ